MGKPRNPHEASASATGYLFQCRYALLAGLRAGPDSPELSISIEKFDDIAFEAKGEPTELIQTKHHIVKTGDLTDSSADLWKTMSIWLKWIAKDIEAPFRTRFILLTTGRAPDESAASFGHQATIAKLLPLALELPAPKRARWVRLALYQNAYRSN